MDYNEALNNLTAADAMDISPTVLNYEGSLEDALELIANENRPDVAVGTESTIAGFVHAQDITGILARGESINIPLRTFIDSCSLSGSKPCIQVRPEESLMNVMKVMDSWGKDNILVVGENEEPLGIISATGAIKCLWKMVSEPLLTKAGPAEAE